MTRNLKITPLTAEAFAPYGDVIETHGTGSFKINNGMCDRHHDLAKLDFIGEGARANISLAKSQPYRLPLTVPMLERHPLGSQAFMPLSEKPYLVVVARDQDGVPVNPQAFLTNGRQGVNYHRNVWHGVLTPLDDAQTFLIVDRTGKGDNLQEHHFDEPFVVTE
jgi:ureidoglycolate lyase